MRILITGFEPFGTETTNPSWEVAREVAAQFQRSQPKLDCSAELLPVSFGPGLDQLAVLVERGHPDLVVCLGLAQGRQELTIERVAVNLIDARIPDNSGAQPIDVPVRIGGHSAYLSTLPIKRAVQASLDSGVPAAISLTAGTYVCNAAFYTAASLMGPGAAAFIHVPQVRDQGGPLSIAQMVKGVAAMVTQFAAGGPDTVVTGGTEF